MQQINIAASFKGISRSEVIIQLLKHVMADIRKPSELGKMVQYQEKSHPDNWHPFHVSLNADDYEYSQDLRKLMKMSVSLILAFAVKKYLPKLMKKNNTDNYRYKDYLILKSIINGIICWTIFWGHPRQFIPPS